MDQAAEHVPSFDQGWGRPLNLGWSDAGRHGKTQAPMRSLVDVVRDVRPEHSFEVSTIVDQDVVEALPAHSPDEPLGEGIRPGGPDRGSDDPDALAAEDRVERSSELGVPVADEEPHPRQPLLDGEVPRLLGDPGRIRVLGHTGQVNVPRGELDEEGRRAS